MKQIKKLGFTVIMKEGTPSKEVSKLIEKVFKNKFVKHIEGKIELNIKQDKKEIKK